MAYWNNLSNQLRPIITTLGDGINTAIPKRDIKESQSPDSFNIDSHFYPALSVRPNYDTVESGSAGATLLMKYKTEKILGIKGSGIFSFEGSSWTYRAGLPTTPPDPDYVNFMDKIYVATGDSRLVEVDPSTWTVTELSEAPTAIGITAHANRLYAIYDNKLHYSGLRMANNWNVVDESGVIQIDTADGEDLIAVEVFNNHVVILSNNGLYELYGTGPLNYEVITITKEIGCIVKSSLVELNNNLMWLGDDGIYAYDGGNLPIKISYPVENYINRINTASISKIKAGRDGRRYYLTLPLDSSSVADETLVFDTELGTWYFQNFGIVKSYVEFVNQMYISSTTSFKKLSNNPEGSNASWYWISKQFKDTDTAKRVTWKRVYLVVDLPLGSTLSIYLSVDEGSWELLYTLNADTVMTRKKILVPISMAYNVDWVSIKLQGTGFCKIHELQRYLMVKPW